MRRISCIPLFNSISWMKLSIKSFFDYLPNEKLLVISNSYDKALEKEFCKCKNIVYIESSGSHADACDLAVNWCRENDYDYLILLEQDFVSYGSNWYFDLLESMKFYTSAGYLGVPDWLMACPPCIWKVDKIKYSFSNINLQFESPVVEYDKIYDIVMRFSKNVHFKETLERSYDDIKSITSSTQIKEIDYAILLKIGINHIIGMVKKNNNGYIGFNNGIDPTQTRCILEYKNDFWHFFRSRDLDPNETNSSIIQPRRFWV